MTVVTLRTIMPAQSLAGSSGIVAGARTAVSDANHTATTSDRLIAYTALTAARTVILPAAAAFPTGTAIIVVDETGACSPTNTITVSPAGSDTVEGGASVALSIPRAFLWLESNGSAAWTIIGNGQPSASALAGTLNVANGGTGDATLTAHAVLLGEGTSAISFATIGTAGRLLTDQGAGTDPAFVAMNGDATFSSSGALTIGSNKIDNSKLAQAPAKTIKGNNTSSPANVTDLTIDQLVAMLGAGTEAQGRLTLTSGAPVLTSTVNAGGTVIYTPYNGNIIPIYDGTQLVPTQFTELSNILSNSSTGYAGPAAAVSSSNYDLFIWNNSGTLYLTRGPAWSSQTSRGAGSGTTQLQRINGVLTNEYAIANGPGANFGTYVGTVMTDATGATVTFNPGSSAAGGGAAWIGLWNQYNRLRLVPTVVDSTTTHTYSGNTVRPYDNSTSNRITVVIGQQEDTISSSFVSAFGAAANGGSGQLGIGIDSTTAFSGAPVPLQAISAQLLASACSIYDGSLIGKHFFQALEAGDGTNSNTFYAAQYMMLTADMRF